MGGFGVDADLDGILGALGGVGFDADLIGNLGAMSGFGVDADLDGIPRFPSQPAAPPRERARRSRHIPHMWLLALAFASPASAGRTSAEVTVWADRFARWRNTRWAFQSQTASPMALMFEDGRGGVVPSHVWQTRAVLLCDPEAELSVRRLEVGCVLEAVSFDVVPKGFQGERGSVRATEVVQGAAEWMQGSRLQLQVADDGRILNLDFEGHEGDSEIAQSANEASRRLLGRIADAWHFRLEDPSATTWFSSSEPLLLPGRRLGSSSGQVTASYAAGNKGDHRIVQFVGEAVSTFPVPIHQSEGSGSVGTASAGGATLGTSTGSGLAASATSARSGMAVFPPPEMWAAVSTVVDTENLVIEVPVRTEASGIAAFERSTGIMTERAWVVRGTGQTTAQAMFSFETGRLSRVDLDRTIDVGPTRIVSPFGDEHTPAWVTQAERPLLAEW